MKLLAATILLSLSLQGITVHAEDVNADAMRFKTFPATKGCGNGSYLHPSGSRCERPDSNKPQFSCPSTHSYNEGSRKCERKTKKPKERRCADDEQSDNERPGWCKKDERQDRDKMCDRDDYKWSNGKCVKHEERDCDKGGKGILKPCPATPYCPASGGKDDWRLHKIEGENLSGEEDCGSDEESVKNGGAKFYLDNHRGGESGDEVEDNEGKEHIKKAICWRKDIKDMKWKKHQASETCPQRWKCPDGYHWKPKGDCDAKGTFPPRPDGGNEPDWKKFECVKKVPKDQFTKNVDCKKVKHCPPGFEPLPPRGQGGYDSDHEYNKDRKECVKRTEADLIEEDYDDWVECDAKPFCPPGWQMWEGQHWQGCIKKRGFLYKCDKDEQCFPKGHHDGGDDDKCKSGKCPKPGDKGGRKLQAVKVSGGAPADDMAEAENWDDAADFQMDGGDVKWIGDKPECEKKETKCRLTCPKGCFLPRGLMTENISCDRKNDPDLPKCVCREFTNMTPQCPVWEDADPKCIETATTPGRPDLNKCFREEEWYYCPQGYDPKMSGPGNDSSGKKWVSQTPGKCVLTKPPEKYCPRMCEEKNGKCVHNKCWFEGECDPGYTPVGGKPRHDRRLQQEGEEEEDRDADWQIEDLTPLDQDVTQEGGVGEDGVEMSAMWVRNTDKLCKEPPFPPKGKCKRIEFKKPSWNCDKCDGPKTNPNPLQRPKCFIKKEGGCRCPADDDQECKWKQQGDKCVRHNEKPGGGRGGKCPKDWQDDGNGKCRRSTRRQADMRCPKDCQEDRDGCTKIETAPPVPKCPNDCEYRGEKNACMKKENIPFIWTCPDTHRHDKGSNQCRPK